MPKYYVTSDCILDDFNLTIIANGPSDAAIKAVRFAINKYHVVYEPSNVYVDERGYKYDKLSATNIYELSKILKNLIT